MSMAQAYPREPAGTLDPGPYAAEGATGVEHRRRHPAMEIRVRSQLACHVVELHGVGNAALLMMLFETVRQLAVEDGPVVLDLTEVTLVDPDALRATLGELSRVSTLRVVSTRDTAREILRRCGLEGDSLFATVADAIDGIPGLPAFEPVED
jgi:anti-anti-sigma regulatory factor